MCRIFILSFIFSSFFFWCVFCIQSWRDTFIVVFLPFCFLLLWFFLFFFLSLYIEVLSIPGTSINSEKRRIERMGKKNKKNASQTSFIGHRPVLNKYQKWQLLILHSSSSSSLYLFHPSSFSSTPVSFQYLIWINLPFNNTDLEILVNNLFYGFFFLLWVDWAAQEDWFQLYLTLAT